jgi:hypothetical protein
MKLNEPEKLTRKVYGILIWMLGYYVGEIPGIKETNITQLACTVHCLNFNKRERKWLL